MILHKLLMRWKEYKNNMIIYWFDRHFCKKWIVDNYFTINLDVKIEF